MSLMHMYLVMGDEDGSFYSDGVRMVDFVLHCGVSKDYSSDFTMGWRFVTGTLNDVRITKDSGAPIWIEGGNNDPLVEDMPMWRTNSPTGPGSLGDDYDVRWVETVSETNVVAGDRAEWFAQTPPDNTYWQWMKTGAPGNRNVNFVVNPAATGNNPLDVETVDVFEMRRHDTLEVVARWTVTQRITFS